MNKTGLIMAQDYGPRLAADLYGFEGKNIAHRAP